MATSDLFNIEKREIAQAGQFEGKFILAMPNIGSDVFDRSIIFICSHGEEGAIGFQINKSADITIRELIARSALGESEEIIVRPSAQVASMVRIGGPVDENRGFVLHSADYRSTTSVCIAPSIYITSSTEILASIANGTGPENVAVSLGYSGWGPGQLEQEIADNAWLVFDGEAALVYGEDNDKKYTRMLATKGIDFANFVPDAGHA